MRRARQHIGNPRWAALSVYRVWVGNGVSGVFALLDRRADQIAPLGPGAIVVAHIRIAEQLGQHKPGVRRTLANAAVGEHLFVGRDTLATIDCAQSAADLKVPSALAAVAQGMLCAPGMWPPRGAPSCG